MLESFTLLLVGIRRTGSLQKANSVYVRGHEEDVGTQEDFVCLAWGQFPGGCPKKIQYTRGNARTSMGKILYIVIGPDSSWQKRKSPQRQINTCDGYAMRT